MVLNFQGRAPVPNVIPIWSICSYREKGISHFGIPKYAISQYIPQIFCVYLTNNSYIPRSVSSLFLIIAEYVSDCAFPFFPLEAMIFHGVYFMLLSQSIRYR